MRLDESEAADHPIVLFFALLHGRRTGNFEVAACAKRRLAEQGIRVTFTRGRTVREGGPPMNPLAPAPEPLLWTIRQTAAALGICEKSVWNLSRTGRLRPVKIGRATRYDRRDIEQFIADAKGGHPMTRAADAVVDTPPPVDLEAERAALGAALQDAEARATVLRTLTADDFADPAHGQLFGFLGEMVQSLEADEKPNVVTVDAALRAAGLFEKIGGREALVDLCEACPAPSAAAAFAKIVKGKSDLRRAIQAGLELARQAGRPDVNLGAAFKTFDRKTRRCRLAAGEAEAATAPVLVCLGDVKAVPVGWLWPGRIALGRMALLVGRPGEGKSFLATDLAARISTGTPFPDGSACPIGSTILISAEDDPGDVLRPRLDAARADARKIHLLRAVRHKGQGQETMFTLRDLDALEMALKMHRDCRLVVVDPIGSFLGGSTDSHRDNEVRAVLAPAAALAERYGPALLVIAHRRKSTADFADDLALGSRAFTGLARTVLHLSRDPENRARRLLLGGKSNLGPESDGLAFAIGGDPPCLAWEREPVRMSADDGLADENAGRKRGPAPKVRSEAETWLLDFLSHGPRLASECFDQAASVGFTEGTLRRAKTALRIVPQKQGTDGPWAWQLPEGAQVSPK